MATYYVEDTGFGGRHGPFGSRAAAERFATALAAGGKLIGIVVIHSEEGAPSSECEGEDEDAA